MRYRKEEDMSNEADRGSEVVYHVPWSAIVSGERATRPMAPLTGQHPHAWTAQPPAASTPRAATRPPRARVVPEAPSPVAPLARPTPAAVRPVFETGTLPAMLVEGDTPLFAAASVLDPAVPVEPDPAFDDTPLFDAVPRYDEVRRDDEERLIRTFRSLPSRWQEVLWFTRVEDVSVTEASIHMGTDGVEAATLADQAFVGLRRAWVADDLGGESIPSECASALWALCGTDDTRGIAHARGCEPCSDVLRRLEDVMVRTSQVLMAVVLGETDKGEYARAV